MAAVVVVRLTLPLPPTAKDPDERLKTRNKSVPNKTSTCRHADRRDLAASVLQGQLTPESTNYTESLHRGNTHLLMDDRM